MLRGGHRLGQAEMRLLKKPLGLVGVVFVPISSLLSGPAQQRQRVSETRLMSGALRISRHHRNRTGAISDQSHDDGPAR